MAILIAAALSMRNGICFSWLVGSRAATILWSQSVFRRACEAPRYSALHVLSTIVFSSLGVPAYWGSGMCIKGTFVAVPGGRVVKIGFGGMVMWLVSFLGNKGCNGLVYVEGVGEVV